MNLKSWAESERGRAMALARAIDVPPSFVSKMISGEKAIPAEHCQAIFKFTSGAVTIPEMRDDWPKYWPELADSAAQNIQPNQAPAHAAPAPIAMDSVATPGQATEQLGEAAPSLQLYAGPDRRRNPQAPYVIPDLERRAPLAAMLAGPPVASEPAQAAVGSEAS
ncbi:MAG TPA: YdaS family helix-turn-helix protein [Polaromonas sp.]|uniref:transcriptional regulator n=1 Tax=Polaromonas sp. TaxID=1869339 RepID=UPI002D417811|nr:YdaS family helix-turn-helix protein [Polaromonas sp.]HYW57700.1 YdaS family helix-turn-helix protein [Polaromonas sp.]